MQLILKAEFKTPNGMTPARFQILLNGNVRTALNGLFKVARDVVRRRVPRSSRNAAGEQRHPARLYETVMLDMARVSTHYAVLHTENPIWEYYDEGTRAHVIRPRGSVSDMVAGTARRALYFPFNGNMVFATRVNHPGTPPHQYWEEAEQMIESSMPATIKMGVDAAMSGQQFTGGESPNTGGSMPLAYNPL